MTTLPGCTSIDLVEQETRIDAVAIEEIIVDSNQHPRLNRSCEIDRLARPEIANDLLLFAEEIAPVDRQKRQVNPLTCERDEYLRDEDGITSMVERHSV